MRTKSIKTFAYIAIPVLAAISAPSQATTFNFNCITNNDTSGASCDISENQMSFDLTDATDADGAKALFTFYNTGSDLESYISDIYFMDGTLLSISSIDDSDDIVSFSEGANPANLPSYNPSASFSADNDPGAINGIHAGEWLGITFELLDGVSFANTLTAMGTGDLVVGIHVQGLGAGTDDGYSESLVHVVPVPAAVWLFGTGLLGLVGVARRKTA